MSLVVVRCPGCLGESRVEADALGQMVACPRCQLPFIAAEEIIPTIQPKSRSRTTSANRSAAANPVAPPRRRPQRARTLSEQELPGDEPKVPDPEHDPHLPPVAGLPVSVLVGLALLPFGIPLLWWAAPVVTGKDATLSLAVPISLAIAASTLCLGVVYTIDWTAATRIKGVLMLVGLAYLSATGLFFLKKDLVERFRAWGGQKIHWQRVDSPEGRFAIKMPGRPIKAEDQPLLPKARMTAAQRVSYRPDTDADEYTYLVASGKLGAEERADDAWFAAIDHELTKQYGEPIAPARAVQHEGHLGREWQFKKDLRYRFVRVFVIEGRVYYLSAEGPNLSATDELADSFFKSFSHNVKD
jgi:hypothetical protein